MMADDLNGSISELLMNSRFKYVTAVVFIALVTGEALFLPEKIFRIFVISWIVLIPVTFGIISYRSRKIYEKQCIYCL